MPVYLIKAGDTPYVKIGVTTDAACAGRLIKMQVDNHEPLSVLRLLDGDKELEAALHERFRTQHHRGEWFLYTETMMGDLGAADWTAPAPSVRDYKPQIWTPKQRDTARGRMLASWSDPTSRATRLAKLRATNARKRMATP